MKEQASVIKVVEALTKAAFIDGIEQKLSCSIGVVIFPDDGQFY